MSARAPLAIVLPESHPQWARVVELPEVRSMARPSFSCGARILVVRGLSMIARGAELPPAYFGAASTLRCAAWVGDLCRELAEERGTSQRALAQGALVLALEALGD